MLKEKRCGKLKGRTCADVMPQRCYTSKEDTSLPNISLEELSTIIIIGAHEGIYVGIFDVPGAYLNVDIP